MDIPRKPVLVSIVRTSKVLQMKPRVNDQGPEPPDPVANIGCRPCQKMLESFRNQILSAVRQRRSHRSIAAQYGVRIVDIWEIVADELTERRERKEAA